MQAISNKITQKHTYIFFRELIIEVLIEFIQQAKQTILAAQIGDY